MRVFGVLISACLAVTTMLGDPVSEVWRPPQPVPSGCASIAFEVVLVDVSKSMKPGNRFIQVVRDVEEHLAGTPPCTLVILGSFGVTADVDEAQFLAVDGGRSLLVSALHRLRPTHDFTNLDEAAKLVELLSYQLRAAYGAQGNRLVVRLYSDLESSPSVGKPSFSLGEYLARRMGGEYTRGTASDAREGVVRVQAAPVIKVGTEAAKAGPERPTGGVIIVASSFCFALALSMCLFFWARRRAGGRADRGVCPAALLVTERVAGEGEAELVGAERRVEVAAGVQVVFSTDANAATYVAAPVATADNGELFRIQPLPDGLVRIQSPHSCLTVNDEPLDVDRRVKVDIREPIRVRLGPREFNIVGVFGRPRALDRADDVFEADALQH